MVEEEDQKAQGRYLTWIELPRDFKRGTMKTNIQDTEEVIEESLASTVSGLSWTIPHVGESGEVEDPDRVSLLTAQNLKRTKRLSLKHCRVLL